MTESQLKTIKSVDKVRKEQRKQTIEKDVDTYSNLLVGGSDGGSVFDKATKRADIQQYMLVLAADLINGRNEFGSFTNKKLRPCRRTAFGSQDLGATGTIQKLPRASQQFTEPGGYDTDPVCRLPH